MYLCHHGGEIYKVTPAPNPVPAITSLDPGTVIAGDPGFTLTVHGTGFVVDSVVRWNGEDRPTTFVSINQITADIPASDLLTAGTADVTVFSPAPGGGLSTAAHVPHQPDVPRRADVQFRVPRDRRGLQRRRHGGMRDRGSTVRT